MTEANTRQEGKECSTHTGGGPQERRPRRGDTLVELQRKELNEGGRGTGIPGTGKSMGKASRKLEWANEPRRGLLLRGVKQDVEREGWQEVAGHRSCLWGQRRHMVGNLRFVVCNNRIATVYGTSSKCQQYTEKRV